jgi:hypothetical protein
VLPELAGDVGGVDEGDVSRRMKSKGGLPERLRFSRSESIVWIRLPLTVQHTHPLFISTHSSTAASPSGCAPCTSIFSTPSSAPNSFRMTATLYPWSACKT